MNETYQLYINRIAPLTLATAYSSQLQNIQKSPKFEGDKAVYFPGYSVITPIAAEDPHNIEFYQTLTEFQGQLLEETTSKIIVPVPPDSFHLTIADLIWDSSYQNAIEENPHFEQQLKGCIQQSFNNYQTTVNDEKSSQWQILGLLIFPRALAVGLVPQDEYSYQKIAELRRSIYQNPDLIALGIEQQYLFNAHITLGYFSDIPTDEERENLVNIFTYFNDKWLEIDPQIISIKQVELRHFTDMTRFEREANDPTLELS